MLKSLQVNNLALVKQAELDFHQGLNIITGETGAGKSLLINALSLVLGERFSKNWLGSFANETMICATFDLSNNPSLINKLKEMSLINENHALEGVVRRVVNKNGLSNNYFNGKKISVKELNTIANNLVDIHSQHSQQSLTKNQFQRKLVDQFASIDLTMMRKYVEQIQSINKEIALRENLELNSEKKLLLEFYVNELNEAELDSEEILTLEQDYKQASQIKTITENLATAENIINSESGINSRVSELSKIIQHIIKFNPQFADNVEAIEQITIGLESIEENLQTYFHKLEENKSEKELELRVNQLDKLARKHQCKIEDLIAIQKKLTDELNHFDSLVEKLNTLREEKNILIKSYQLEAKKNSQIRKRSAKKLEDKITKRLNLLAMTDGKVKFEIISDENLISEHGFDKVEIKVSLNKTNPIEADFFSLKKVASGGELSRISLAIETELADSSSLNTLVFDEVDSGIGGDIANQIGLSLAKLANKHQVICITHLAQIAVYGTCHQMVEKETQGDKKSLQNMISIKTLNKKEQKIAEIARMLSGNLHSQSSLEHAKNIFEYAQKQI